MIVHNRADQIAFPLCSKNEKITLKAHGGLIDIEGLAVAKVNDKLQIQSVEVWFDPQMMFRQMAEKPVDPPAPLKREELVSTDHPLD